jgi:hypothetical protein
VEHHERGGPALRRLLGLARASDELLLDGALVLQRRADGLDVRQG